VFVRPPDYGEDMTQTCPKCKGTSSLREVIYGMPDGPLDDSKYITGGCCLSEKDPMTTCIECGWEGDFRNNVERFEF